MATKSINYDSQRLVIENTGKCVQVVVEYYKAGHIEHADLVCKGDVPVEILMDGEFQKKPMMHIYPK